MHEINNVYHLKFHEINVQKWFANYRGNLYLVKDIKNYREHPIPCKRLELVSLLVKRLNHRKEVFR